MPSNAEIDRLGERYRRHPSDVATLRDLFLFCADVKSRTSDILPKIRTATSLPISPRDGKSFASIREKLNREHVKRSAMQDIEGCRILVGSLAEQDALLFHLRCAFDQSTIYDRRAKPSHGYRAVHLVVRVNGARYEIQIRTQLQHSWAEVSERLSERFGREVRYGQTPSSPEAARVGRALQEVSGALEYLEKGRNADLAYLGEPAR